MSSVYLSKLILQSSFTLELQARAHTKKLLTIKPKVNKTKIPNNKTNDFKKWADVFDWTTRQYTTRQSQQNKTKRDRTKQVKEEQDKTWHDKIRQTNISQDKMNQCLNNHIKMSAFMLILCEGATCTKSFHLERSKLHTLHSIFGSFLYMFPSV